MFIWKIFHLIANNVINGLSKPVMVIGLWIGILFLSSESKFQEQITKASSIVLLCYFNRSPCKKPRVQGLVQGISDAEVMGKGIMNVGDYAHNV